MSYRDITTDEQLRSYCKELADCKSIAFDTEFVSEHTYRPVLCLVQVAADGDLALIDAIKIGDMTPFWQAVSEPGHETIVHAGRGEVEFCYHAVGRPPEQLVDVQIAAGLIGLEYPAGYSSLISKLLGKPTQKHETRTDWQRRPLSKRQIDYAMDDVIHLNPLRDKLLSKIESLGRMEWFWDEMNVWGEGVRHYVTNERWRRVSGNSGLKRRSLAIVRELWRWREAEAERRNRPARRILRDDLLVELAKRQSADPKRICAVRGFERGDLRKLVPQMAEKIERAIELSDDECPQVIRHKKGPQLSVLGQFLFSALGSVCREMQLAPGLVGTPNDVRELIAYRNDPDHLKHHKRPKLAGGWRAEVVGQLFDDLLAGKKSVKIVDPTSDHPLTFEPTDEK